MDRKEIERFGQLWQEVVEKKKLDPVNHDALKGSHADRKDKDIDNDGDVDSSDEYLHNRRATVKKKMKHSRSGHLGGHQKEDVDGCEVCGCEECECELEESKDLNTDNVGKALRHDCATHVQHEQWGAGECISGEHTLEEQEDGTAIVTHYDVMFEHGIEHDVAVEDLEIVAEKSHLHANYKKKMKEDDDPCWDSHKMVGMKKKGGKMVPNCVPKEEVEHEEEVIAEDTVAEFEQEVQTTYNHFVHGTRAALAQMWEKAQQAKHGSEGKYKDDQLGLQPQAAKDFASQHDYDNAEVKADAVKDAEKTAAAGKSGKQSPARSSADKLSNGDTKPVKQGA